MKRLKAKFKAIKSFKLKDLTYQHITAGIVIICVVAIGIHLIISSFAASPFSSIGASSGKLTSPATSQACTGSSNGNCVQFGCAQTSSINTAPCGPPVPVSGWHVDLADGFKAPLGPDTGTETGNDNLWYPSQSSNTDLNNDVNGDNPNETECYNANQVSVAGGDLVLTAKYQYDVAKAGVYCGGSGTTADVQRNYVSGIVTTPTDQPGYKGFTWTPGNGSTLAFEIVSQWPLSTGNLWDAFWTSSPAGWTDERDFFEGYSSSNKCGNIDSDWIYQTPDTPLPGAPTGTMKKLQDFYCNSLGFDPSAQMHRYTYLIYPNQSWSLYIDGVLQTWVGTNGIAPVENNKVDAPMELLINYALNSNATTFSSGTNQFLIKSVAVYQDTANAGQGITGGGIAPGTSVGSN
jgi:hypothetical protein